jgi:2-methylcitrate dehydratase PrpD
MQAAGNSQTILDAATAKKLQVGFASRAAVLGTLLASRGLTGPHDILEGKYGYYELYERGKHNLGQAFADLGNSWEIDNISVKPFSCARETHAAIFAALEASASRKFALADIDHVVVTGPGILQDISGKPPATAGPASVVSAHLSIPYVVAVILLEGDLTLLDFTQARVLRPERQALANSIRVEAATTLPHNDLAPVDLAITTREGGVIRGRCTELPSGIASGLDESAMERKRRSCVNISPWPEAASCLARVGDLLRVAESTSDLPRALIECMSPL